jgi:hypothetical protein
MGLDTQAVLEGHPGLDQLCSNLVTVYGASHVQRRPMRSADYWIVEFIDRDGELRTVNVFLNSMAGADFPELGLVNSVLLTIELGPTSEAVLQGMAHGRSAWLRRHEQLQWAQLEDAGPLSSSDG